MTPSRLRSVTLGPCWWRCTVDERPATDQDAAACGLYASWRGRCASVTVTAGCAPDVDARLAIQRVLLEALKATGWRHPEELGLDDVRAMFAAEKARKA